MLLINTGTQCLCLYPLCGERSPQQPDYETQAGTKILWIAFGIKYSIDHGCRGDVVFDAKTDELARHYELGFHARRIPSLESGGPKRYMLADEDAWRMFSKFLGEEEL